MDRDLDCFEQVFDYDNDGRLDGVERALYWDAINAPAREEEERRRKKEEEDWHRGLSRDDDDDSDEYDEDDEDDDSDDDDDGIYITPSYRSSIGSSTGSSTASSTPAPSNTTPAQKKKAPETPVERANRAIAESDLTYLIIVSGKMSGINAFNLILIWGIPFLFAAMYAITWEFRNGLIFFFLIVGVVVAIGVSYNTFDRCIYVKEFYKAWKKKYPGEKKPEAIKQALKARRVMHLTFLFIVLCFSSFYIRYRWYRVCYDRQIETYKEILAEENRIIETELPLNNKTFTYTESVEVKPYAYVTAKDKDLRVSRRIELTVNAYESFNALTNNEKIAWFKWVEEEYGKRFDRLREKHADLYERESSTYEEIKHLRYEVFFWDVYTNYNFERVYIIQAGTQQYRRDGHRNLNISPDPTPTPYKGYTGSYGKYPSSGSSSYGSSSYGSSSYGSSSKGRKTFDYYDTKDYDDPEDFYYDYEDDFEDYEDAEDYWEEYH